MNQVFYFRSQIIHPYGLYIKLWLFATVLWVIKWIVMKKSLKLLLSYHGWMYESRNKISKLTKIWMVSKLTLSHNWKHYLLENGLI